MFAKRNSLTLGGIWLALLIVGVLWYVNDTRALMKVLQARTKHEAALEKSRSQIERLTEVEAVYEQMKEKWQNSPKRIIAAEEPAFTLAYLNWIVSENGLDINYDFVLNETNKSGDYTRFTYTLSGEGTYESLNEMIWYLTYQPLLYKINNITLSRAENSSEHLRFNLRLHGFTIDEEAEAAKETAKPEASLAKVYQAQYNIFKPLLATTTVSTRKPEPPRLPKKLPGQIDVEKAKLRAVTPNSIFLSDGHGLVELKVGDAVYLGKLTQINQAANQAVFKITKFGKTTTITLGIDERD